MSGRVAGIAAHRRFSPEQKGFAPEHVLSRKRGEHCRGGKARTKSCDNTELRRAGDRSCKGNAQELVIVIAQKKGSK